MSFTRGQVVSATCGLLLLGVWSTTGHAQLYEAARQSLDFAPDATARSPRLMGMGRLSLASDVHGRINLWELSGNPIGVIDADSSSTFELRPATISTASRHVPLGSPRERQDLAGREMRLGYEALRRSGTTAYGFFGDVATMRADHPFDEATAKRARFDEPNATLFLTGAMPRFQSERMRYAIHTFYESETAIDEYLTIFSNAEGDYLGHGGDLRPAPNFFDPDEHRVSTIGGGLDFSYRLGPWLTAALGGLASSSRIEGENSSLIHSTGTGEDRPYYAFRLGAVGTLGGLQYAAEGRNWTSSSEERFVFTLKAGQNQEPFTGRGKVLDREEEGSEARGRVRWSLGSLEANAGARTWTREAKVSPPLPGDVTSFNYFLNTASHRDGADSLALPDSIRRTRDEDSGWEFAYGATWRFGGGRSLIGFESHVLKLEATDVVFANPVASGGIDPVAFSSEGPERKAWDFRGGLEYGCTAALKGRLGYIYRYDDRDELTSRNEYTSNTLTAGFGVNPPGAIWTIDLGWAAEWISPDFDDPAETKQSRQQVAAQIRWVF